MAATAIRKTSAFTVSALGLAVALPSFGHAQARSDSAAKAVVTAVTMGTIYVGAGRNDGRA